LRRERDITGIWSGVQIKGRKGRFLKKAAQKLFRLWVCGGEPSTVWISKVFLLLFVHKK
jgi:hypothetical protein